MPQPCALSLSPDKPCKGLEHVAAPAPDTPSLHRLLSPRVRMPPWQMTGTLPLLGCWCWDTATPAWQITEFLCPQQVLRRQQEKALLVGPCCGQHSATCCGSVKFGCWRESNSSDLSVRDRKTFLPEDRAGGFAVILKNEIALNDWFFSSLLTLSCAMGLQVNVTTALLYHKNHKISGNKVKLCQ